jgi:hypothetical protein
MQPIAASLWRLRLQDPNSNIVFVLALTVYIYLQRNNREQGHPYYIL